MPKTAPPATGIVHGATTLPSVVVDSYNLEIEDGDGFVGDRASNSAFRGILDGWRERVAEAAGEDPFGEVETRDIPKKLLDKLLLEGEPEIAGIIHSAVEDFAQAFAAVVRRFLRAKGWRDTERIAVGGGFRESRMAELAVGRTMALLKEHDVDVRLSPIRHHPDEAGLVGAVHLAPAWVFSGHDGLLAVDIGGSNIRAGVVRPRVKKAPDLSKAEVWRAALWRHRDEEPTREQAVEELARMLRELIEEAEAAEVRLAPFIGIGCPGVIRDDGTIDRGAQNLPGNWESRRFNLPARLREAIPAIGGHETTIVMHNDAVVQGLSEIPAMTEVARWGILTIGTGLGNARFTNRSKAA
jgi:hypothetical protein